MRRDLKSPDAQILRKVWEISPSAIMVTDPAGKIEYVNPAFEKLTGDTAAEVMGRNHILLGSPGQSPEIPAGLWETISSGGTWSGQLGNRRRDGSAYRMSCTIAPLQDEEGKILHYVAAGEIVTTEADAGDRDVRQEDERQAREKMMLLEAIMESPQGVVLFSLDREYRYTQFTRAHRETMKNIWGVDIRAGMNMLEAIGSPGDREIAKNNFDRALRGESLLLVEEYGDHALQRTFYENRYNPIRDLSGEILGLTVFVIDIGGRMRAQESLRESEEKFRLAFSNANIGMCLVDLQGKLFQVNDKMSVIFGYSKQELESMTVNDLALPEDAGLSMHFIRRSIEGSQDSETFEKRYRHRLGHIIYGEVSSSLVRDARGEPRYFISQVQDITKRKLAEEDLQRSTKRAGVLSERAESAARAKSEFLAMMSHELRTPLNGVLGFADYLREADLSDTHREYVDLICESGTHLLHVVNDILDFSSIEKSKMSLQITPVDIATLATSTCASVRKTAEAKGLIIRCEVDAGTPREILCDGRRVRQILFNLLGNAVKFTPSGSVALLVSCADDAKKAISFAVTDTGPGIEPDLTARLFEPFTQGDSTLRRQFEGSGLGLAISQELATLMNGTISVTSEPGRGSTFTFKIPLEIQTGGTAGKSGTKQPSPAKFFDSRITVLVAEDDRVSRRLIGMMLEQLGLASRFVENGLEAFEAVRTGGFSAVLMDMQMPVMDGIEATAKVRAYERVAGGHIPIIALTANVMDADRQSCLESGMDAFITKPLRIAELAEKLSAFLDPSMKSGGGKPAAPG